jgi:hypothetical protein
LQTYNTTERCNNYVAINKCHIHDCRRQGISIVNGQNVVIRDCHIHDIRGTAPESGIDFECHGNFKLSNILVDNCKIHDTNKASIILSNNSDTVTIRDCDIEHLNAINCNDGYIANVRTNNMTVRCDKLTLENVRIKNKLYCCSNSVIVNCSKIHDLQITGGNVIFNDCDFVDSKQIMVSKVNDWIVKNVEFNKCDFNPIVNEPYLIRVDSYDNTEVVAFNECNIKYESGTEFCNGCKVKRFVLKNCTINFAHTTYKFLQIAPYAWDGEFVIEGCTIKPTSKLTRLVTGEGRSCCKTLFIIKDCCIENYIDLFTNVTNVTVKVVCQNNLCKQVNHVSGVTGSYASNVTVYEANNITL